MTSLINPPAEPAIAQHVRQVTGGRASATWYLDYHVTRFRTLLGLFFLCVAQSHASPPPGYVLHWSDEFEGSSLDTTKWNYRALGPRNDAINTTAAVSVANGELTITTFTEGGTNFTSMIGTEGLYMPLYGYMEARIKFNDSPGEWSAFWMQSPTMTYVGDPHAYGTEIDIVEHRVMNLYLNDVSDIGVANIHWDGYGAEHRTVGSGRVGSGLATGWHLYAMEWTKDRQSFYYDGVLVWGITNSSAQDPIPPEAPVSQRSQYFILSSEVRDKGWAGVIPPGGYGSLAASTTRMQVDYVRSYSPSPTYTLTYNAGPHGEISGASPQYVAPGGSGAPVTAIPDPGYYFLDWSDGVRANPRFEGNVTKDVNVTASFSIIPAPLLGASDPGGQRIIISFHGIEGLSYVLEQSTDLEAWIPLRTNVAPANGLIAHTNSVSQGSHAFYRTRSN